VADAVPLGQGISGWVAQHDQPLMVVPDNLTRFRTTETREVQQAICVPLHLEGQVIGVLNLSLIADSRRAFSADDMHLAQILADAAATAITKAELLEKVSTRTSELSQANRQLAAQRNKLQWTIDSLAEGVFVLDATDQMTLLNGIAAEQLGVSAAEMVGHNFAEYLRQQGLEELRGLLQRARVEATPHSGAVLYRGPLQAGSDKVLELQITPICMQGEAGTRCEGTVTTVRDVTVEVQQEQARSQFIAKLAQDIRTPLTVIKGYVDLMRGKEIGPLTPQQEEFLGRVSAKLEEAVAMIVGLLDLSRVREGHLAVYFELVDVAAVVREVNDLIQPQVAGKLLDLRVTVPPQIGPILAGRTGLRQVLLNLLGNAIKHTSTQGQVLLRVEDEGAQLKFAVQDTGLVIPSEARGKVFQRNAEEGRGRSSIGLYVAKQIVEAHRGAIWFESEPGKGTVFYFTLPKDPTQGAVEEGKGV
jgi:PAS domain S-box-containing protein